LRIALAEPDDWNPVVHQIDAAFGQGVTEKLQADRIPIILRMDGGLSFYLVPREWLDRITVESESFDPHMLGLWLGDMKRGEFKLALPVLHHIVPLTDKRIVVSRHAAEAFTYGRSILRESVLKIEPTLQRGQQVLVLNTDDECLGLAALSVDAGRLQLLSAHELVAKNVMDIGWYLRRFS
jgi:ribosome biogenesis protein Nip4